ncbi:MAG: hypothetical protein IPL23_24950 [Saprospiraceae bacterium]|nr:hypothetical protein [Saprospiraceae bacterium]
MLVVNYFTGTGGTGTALNAGAVITSTQTIYVYAETGTMPNCTDENSFVVTINNTPVADDPSDVAACDSYTLPVLAVGNYFTGAGGTGTALNAGAVITSTQTIYVYAETGTMPNCTDENSFVVTINPKPTLATITSLPVCEGNTTTITLTGLLPNVAGVATYTVGGGPAQTQAGTANGSGEFSFITPVLTLSENGLTIEVTKLTVNGTNCETTFTGKTTTLVVNPKPTLATITSLPVCEGNTTTITLTGLLPNGAGVATYTVGGGPAQTQAGTANGSGEFSFITPVLTLAENGLIIEVTKLTVDGTNCETTFTGKTTSLVVNPKPTLATITSLPVCEGNTTTITLTGLLQNVAGVATYTVGGGPAQTQAGTANGSGEFSFITPVLSLAENGLIIEVTKLTVDGTNCETTFTGKTTTLVVNPKPTLATITSLPVCEGNTTTITLTGLLPNVAGVATYTVGGGPAQTQAGTADGSGVFSFITPVLTLAENGLIIEVTKLTVDGTNCETTFTGKTTTLVVNPKPTLATITSLPVCEGNTTTITLTGLLPNVAGVATYTVGGGPAQTQTGAADGSGVFSFITPVLTLAENGLIIEVTKLTVDGTNCETTFTGKTTTLVVNPKPTLATITSLPVCEGNTTIITLSGLLPNVAGVATYTVGGGPAQTQAGTANVSGEFSFTTPLLSLSENGLIIEVTKLTVDGTNCETTFTGKTTTLVVNPKPTLATITSLPVCEGNTTTITLTGLLPNVSGVATYTVGGGPAQTQAGTANGSGEFSFITPLLTLAENGLIIEVTKLTVDGTNCETTFTGKTTTLVVYAKPVVNAGSYSPVCENAPDVILTGSPMGGTFSGVGVTGNSFGPSVGTQIISYAYTDVNGCSNSATTTITVNPVNFIVTSLADSGPGSLRDILNAPCAPDTIYFDNILSGNVINLTSGEISINRKFVLLGIGANNLTISGSSNRIFNIGSLGDVEVKDLTLSTSNLVDGNIILAGNGKLILRNTTLVRPMAGAKQCTFLEKLNWVRHYRVLGVDQIIII